MVDVGYNVLSTSATERMVEADRAKFVSFKDTLPSGNNGDMLVLDSTTTLGFKSGGAPPASVSFTAGMIMLWSGTIATIPAGWVLCDGNNGTPNLVDRFVVCAKQDDAGVAKTNITGSATQSGGSISYTPAGTNTGLAAVTHAGTAVDSHATSAVAAGTLAPRTFLSAPTAHTVTQPNDHPAHNHVFTGTAATIIPPYYALAYIMKT